MAHDWTYSELFFIKAKKAKQNDHDVDDDYYLKQYYDKEQEQFSNNIEDNKS